MKMWILFHPFDNIMENAAFAPNVVSNNFSIMCQSAFVLCNVLNKFTIIYEHMTIFLDYKS